MELLATQFFVDIEGHPDDENVRLAFEELGFFSKEVKILVIILLTILEKKNINFS